MSTPTVCFHCIAPATIECPSCNDRRYCQQHDDRSHLGKRSEHERHPILFCDMCEKGDVYVSCFDCPGTESIRLCASCFDFEHTVSRVGGSVTIRQDECATHRITAVATNPATTTTVAELLQVAIKPASIPLKRRGSDTPLQELRRKRGKRTIVESSDEEDTTAAKSNNMELDLLAANDESGSVISIESEMETEVASADDGDQDFEDDLDYGDEYDDAESGDGDQDFEDDLDYEYDDDAESGDGDYDDAEDEATAEDIATEDVAAEDEAEDAVLDAPVWGQTDVDSSTIHVPKSTFVPVATSPILLTVSDLDIDQLLNALLNLSRPQLDVLANHLSPYALLRLRKRGHLFNKNPLLVGRTSHSYVYRFRADSVKTLDPDFLRAQTVAAKKWFNSRKLPLKGRKLWLRDLLEFYMSAPPSSPKEDGRRTKRSSRKEEERRKREEEEAQSRQQEDAKQWSKLAATVFPLLELDFLGNGSFTVKTTKGILTNDTSPIPDAILLPPVSSPKQTHGVYPMTPAKSAQDIIRDRKLDLHYTCHGWDHGWFTTQPASNTDYQSRLQQRLNDPRNRDLGSMEQFLESIPGCLESKKKEIAEDKKRLTLYHEQVAAYMNLVPPYKSYRNGQCYLNSVSDFRTYEKTWTAEKGTLGNLFNILENGYQRLQLKANEKATATGARSQSDRVLNRTLSIMFNGVSDERTFAPLSEELARALGPVLTVQTVGGLDRQTYSIPLMVLKYFPPELVALVPVQVEAPGRLEIYFRKQRNPADKRQVSRRPSIIVSADGSCTGTRRGAAVLPFLTIWNNEFTRVSQTLGKLLGHCIFCRHRISTESSLTRGSGDTCFRKYGISTGLVLEDTSKHDVVKHVQVDRRTATAAAAPSENASGDDGNAHLATAADAPIITLLASDGPCSFSWSDPLVANSALLSDMCRDAGYNNEDIEPLPLPAFIDSAALRRLNEYERSLPSSNAEVPLSQLLTDLRVYDFFGVSSDQIMSKLGRTVSSILAGRHEGLF